MCIRDRDKGAELILAACKLNKTIQKIDLIVQEEFPPNMFQRFQNPKKKSLIIESLSMQRTRLNFIHLITTDPVSYTHLRAHETSLHLVCRLLLEKKKTK
eukprot:TRINITY_DN27399_c0_g1_i1.p2 TRINITY_DN27399_c0_g1~~TRINITY_DN27399_c0_g1_i1.p2  ORF type:complete len:100 (-),score=20.86 TRINITY_DN27399_c0_g1_i1:69-368(-)